MAEKGDKGGKKPHKNKPTSAKYKHYRVSGDKAIRSLKFCPRCGPGIFLGVDSNRIHCGKCNFTEFSKK
jgi:small subunit ribosomal protein S27Ae